METANRKTKIQEIDKNSKKNMKKLSKNLEKNYVPIQKEEVITEEHFRDLWLNSAFHSSLLVKSGQDWQSQLMKEEQEKAIPLAIRRRLKEHAQSLYFEDLGTYKRVKAKKMNASNDKMRKIVLSHGTTKDKIAALALECMDSPVHTLNSFNTLISYVGPKGKNQYFEIIDHIKNLIDSSYLVNKYVAKEFECHNFSMLIPLISSNKEKVEKQLVLWYFEDQLLNSYQTLVRSFEKLTSDTVQTTKQIGLKGLLGLIQSHPHQMKEEILAILVNKLGDSAKKTAAFIQRGLCNVIQAHSFTKITLLSLVEEILYRPNVHIRVQHSALSFLKDFILRNGEEKLAQTLVKLYLGFFKSCAKSGEVDSRFMSVLLRGLYRAHPYALKGGDKSALQENLDTLFKLCHFVNFNIATQALQLIYQIESSNDTIISNRFYQLVYKQLLCSSFGGTASCSAFLNLIFKAMCKDPEVQRVRAFAKRLLQVSKFHRPQNVCAILFLISEVVKDNPKLGNNFNNLFTFQNLSSLKIKLEVNPKGNEDNKNNFASIGDLRTTQYDPSIRNPLFCGAQFSSLWELKEMESHYHPTVALFATRILRQEFIDYSGDPLEDFTLIKFLNRFVQRNPKKITEEKGGGYLFTKEKSQPKGSKRLNVDGKEFSNLDEKKVPVEDLFFHRYAKSYKNLNKEPCDDQDDSSDDDYDDDEFEAIMRKKKYGQYVGGKDVDDDFDAIDFKKYVAKVDKDLGDEFGEFDGQASEDDEGIDQDFSGDEEAMVAGSDEDDEFYDDCDESYHLKKAAKNPKKRKQMEMDDDYLDGLIADPEDYAHLLDDGYKNAGTSEEIFIRDKSSKKQLAWEKKRYGSKIHTKTNKKSTQNPHNKKDSTSKRQKFVKNKRRK